MTPSSPLSSKTTSDARRAQAAVSTAAPSAAFRKSTLTRLAAARAPYPMEVVRVGPYASPCSSDHAGGPRACSKVQAPAAAGLAVRVASWISRAAGRPPREESVETVLQHSLQDGSEAPHDDEAAQAREPAAPRPAPDLGEEGALTLRIALHGGEIARERYSRSPTWRLRRQDGGAVTTVSSVEAETLLAEGRLRLARFEHGAAVYRLRADVDAAVRAAYRPR